MGAAAARVEIELASAAMVRFAGLARGAAAWAGDDRRSILQLLDRVVDGLSAARAAVLVAEREAGAWQGGGDRSFEAWRARTAMAGERSAAAQVRQAEQLGTVPSAAAAVTEGRISLEHAAVIAKVASTGTPAQQSAARCAEGQQRLLDLAEELDAGAFALTVARWASTIDPDALERDHEAQRSERFLHLAETPRGTLVKGRLDSTAGHRLRLALEALTPRPAAEDDRDPGQRRADALDAMAGRILGSAETKPGGHVPPQVSLILTAETWAAARAERSRRRRAAEGRPPATGLSAPDAMTTSARDDAPRVAKEAGPVRAAYAPATLEDGTPVPASELAKVLCDCELTRVVIDADGAPLDLGRTQRLYTREQRRAVIARDRECIWPGCHLHARWCEVHHIHWWERDAGPTSVDNGALLCGFHHHEVHRRDLVITRRSDAPRGEPTARGRPRHPIASVAYELRERTGRLVGTGVGPPGEGAAAAEAAPPGPTMPVGALPRPSVGPQVAGTNGADAAPTADRTCLPTGGAPDRPELDLEWVTDEFTGMRVPTLLL